MRDVEKGKEDLRVSGNKPVRDAIRKLWRFQFSSAQEAADALRKAGATSLPTYDVRR